MSINNTNVSITFEFLEAILAAGFNITTTRLLIAMIYMQDRQDLWRSDDLFVQAPEQAETWAFGKELRALVGPFGTNNARCLKQLINDTEGTGLFDMIVMTDGNTRIRWRFSSAVHEHMALRWLGDAFALLDIQHVAACRSMTTLELYSRTMNLRNHRIPEFALPVKKRWCDYRREFCQSMQQVAGMVGTTAFVGLEWVRRGEGSQRLLVRLRHEGTTWYPDKIRSWAFNARVFRISTSGIVEIDGRELGEYAIGGENPEQVEVNLRKNLGKSDRTEAFVASGLREPFSDQDRFSLP